MQVDNARLAVTLLGRAQCCLIRLEPRRSHLSTVWAILRHSHLARASDRLALSLKCWPPLGVNGGKPLTYAAGSWNGWVGEQEAKRRAERLCTLALLRRIPMDEGPTVQKSHSLSPLPPTHSNSPCDLSYHGSFLGSPPCTHPKPPFLPSTLENIFDHGTLGELNRFRISSRPRLISQSISGLSSTPAALTCTQCSHL